MRKLLMLIVFVFLLGGVAFSQEKKEPEKPKEVVQKPPVKAIWKMPSYMVENLQFMLDEFNRKWNDKLEFFKKELLEKFPEFKDMPSDVLFDLQSGVFITRAEAVRLAEEAAKKASEPVKKK